MSAAPHRLDFEYRIEWEGTWHVGSGYGSAHADRLVRRRGGRGGTPFVPGSQVKGVLRHQAERLTASLGRLVVSPHATGRDQQEDLVRHFRPLGQSALLVDRLFGSRYQGECLFVDDALALPLRGVSGSPAHETRLLARTAIDRLTGTAKEGHLFVTEVAEGDGVAMRGRVRARHPAGALLPHEGFPLEYALLVAAVVTVEALGGDKATGQGLCRVVPDGPIRWRSGPRDQSLSSGDALAVFRDGEWETYVGLYEEGGRSS